MRPDPNAPIDPEVAALKGRLRGADGATGEGGEGGGVGVTSSGTVVYGDGGNGSNGQVVLEWELEPTTKPKAESA